MQNNIRVFFLILLSLMVSCQKNKDTNNDKLEQQKIAQIKGRDIRIISKEFSDKGFYVTEIVDLTGEGKHLTMTVDLNGKQNSFIETFGYVTGVDLSPWEKSKITQLKVRSDMNYIVINAEFR